MTLPRMTIRRWIVVVAVAALLLWGERARNHWRRCQWMAYQHADEEECELRVGADPEFKEYCCGMATPNPESNEVRRLRRARYRVLAMRAASYHAYVKRKFERAAWRPWEAIPRDPYDPPDRSL
jgi:hypothetical protein